MTQKTEAVSDDDFGAMFEASLKQKKPAALRAGEKVTGTVVQVGKDRLLLDLGHGRDAMMELHELGEPDARPVINVGDELSAFVLRADDRMAELCLKAGQGDGGRLQLEEAQQSGLPVEGTVKEVNKGGYVVEVGSSRCFCPMGAMDVRRIEDPNTMLGQKLLFKVTEARGGRDVVLSRRAILEQQNAQRAVETRKLLSVGVQMRGTVVGVRDFGAFVDLGGVEGLVPASELAYGRNKPQDVVSVGQQVDVEVVRMEPGKDGKERISLSIKALASDPFDAAAMQLPDGTVVVGTVTRVQPFGAFVELVPGVEGLIHVSAFGKRVGHPQEVVKPGQVVAVRVDHADVEARRIALHFLDVKELADRGWTLPQAAPTGAAPAEKKGNTIMRKAERAEPEAAPAAAVGLRLLGRVETVSNVATAPGTPVAGGPRTARLPTQTARVGDLVDVTVDKVETFGVFVSFATGRGLVPGSELGLPRNTDLRKHFPVGSQFKATVVEIRDDGKLNLSKTAVERAEERAVTEAYMQKNAPAQGKGFGTFGDLLKNRASR